MRNQEKSVRKDDEKNLTKKQSKKSVVKDVQKVSKSDIV